MQPYVLVCVLVAYSSAANGSDAIAAEVVTLADVDHTGQLGDRPAVALEKADGLPEKAWNADEGLAFDNVLSASSSIVNSR